MTMGRRIASQSKQTVRGGPKPAKVGLHRTIGDYLTISRRRRGDYKPIFTEPKAK